MVAHSDFTSKLTGPLRDILQHFQSFLVTLTQTQESASSELGPEVLLKIASNEDSCSFVHKSKILHLK